MSVASLQLLRLGGEFSSQWVKADNIINDVYMSLNDVYVSLTMGLGGDPTALHVGKIPHDVRAEVSNVERIKRHTFIPAMHLLKRQLCLHM